MNIRSLGYLAPLVGAAMGASAALAADTDTVRIGLGLEPTSIDPHFWSGIPNVQMGQNIFDHLIVLEGGKLTPALATSWKTLDDKTWEIKLRPGVKFHDGSPFTADDVVFSFLRVRTAGLKQFAPFSDGKEIKKIDDLTIHITSAKSNPLVPNDFAPYAIVSKKHTPDDGKPDEFNAGKATIGTGPYKFIEWKKGERVLLDANPAYWGEKPKWAKVILQPIPAGPSRVGALLAGQVDIIDYVPTTDIQKLKQNASLTISQAPSTRIIFFFLDQGRDESPYVTLNDGSKYPNPLRDVRVRQAMSKAIDRKAIQERVMDGLSVPASQLIAKEYFGYNPNIPVEVADVEAAKKMMVQAGYPDGFKITLHGPNDRYDNDTQIMEAIAQMLARINIKVDVQAMPSTTYFTQSAKYELSFGMMANSSATGESSFPLRQYLHTYSPGTQFGLTGLSRYQNMRLDPIVEEAVSVIDDAKRLKMFQDIMAIGMRDVAYMPLHYQVNTWAMKKGITYKARSDERTLAVYVGKN
ncbi:MAG: ABC transporter substrate-binding protein [Rhodospirillales bacterium]|nr:ABC transporter substrate-binding protein [Rhodospirillales bacterium]